MYSRVFPNINNDHGELQQNILFNWCSHFVVGKYLPQRVTMKVKCKYTWSPKNSTCHIVNAQEMLLSITTVVL